MRPYSRFPIIPPSAHLCITPTYRKTIHRPDGPDRVLEVEQGGTAGCGGIFETLPRDDYE